MTTKCKQCGYEHGIHIDDAGKIIPVGDKGRFRDLHVVDKDDERCEVRDPDKKDMTILMCPSCGNLFIEVYE